MHDGFLELVREEDSPKLWKELEPKGRREHVDDHRCPDDPRHEWNGVSKDEKHWNHNDSEEGDVVNLLSRSFIHSFIPKFIHSLIDHTVCLSV